MMDNLSLITKFYSAFANHDAEAMVPCYHPDAEFHDPVFGTLRGRDVSDMWSMLIQRSGGQLSITFSEIDGNGDFGSCNWTAYYVFSKTGRKVVTESKLNSASRTGSSSVIKTISIFGNGRIRRLAERDAFGMDIFPPAQNQETGTSVA